VQQQGQDFFSLYFRYYEDTEPPVIFHRWSAITCLSAYLGRQYWFPFGASRLFPNFYTMLIGHPGARKSTAIKLGKKLFSAAGYASYAAEKTSKEKFLLDLEGLTDDDIADNLPRGKRKRMPVDVMEEIFGKDVKDELKEPKEVFIVADEFNEFVGSGNLEFLSLLGMLWDWDDPDNDYQFRLKNSKSVSIYQPTISILSGNTHAGFVEAFPPQAIGQGFLSRLILVYGEPSGKKIPFPTTPSESLRTELIDHIHRIKKEVVGPATVDKDATHALKLLYTTFKDLEDGRFKHYSTRRFNHLLKLLLVISAARCSTTITERDVVLGNSILSWTERDMPKALGEFGKSRDSDVAGKIMNALYETRTPLTSGQLLKIVSKDIEKPSQLGDIMVKLQNAGQVQWVKEAGGFLAKQQALVSEALFLDYTILREHNTMYGRKSRLT
jgi:hypothetical protein